MARRKAHTVKPDAVVWFAPETLHQAELAQKLAEATDPEEVQQILNERPQFGEFREHQGDELVVGDDGIQRLTPNFGDRLVYINENPEDQKADQGHFEVYDSDLHGDEYRPVIDQRD